MCADDSENAPVRFLNAPSFKRFSSFQQTSDKSKFYGTVATFTDCCVFTRRSFIRNNYCCVVVESAPKKTSMCRHASLEQICAVVEQERAKLYSPSASMPGEKGNNTFRETINKCIVCRIIEH